MSDDKLKEIMERPQYQAEEVWITGDDLRWMLSEIKSLRTALTTAYHEGMRHGFVRTRRQAASICGKKSLLWVEDAALALPPSREVLLTAAEAARRCASAIRDMRPEEDGEPCAMKGFESVSDDE